MAENYFVIDRKDNLEFGVHCILIVQSKLMKIVISKSGKSMTNTSRASIENVSSEYFNCNDIWCAILDRRFF